MITNLVDLEPEDARASACACARASRRRRTSGSRSSRRPASPTHRCRPTRSPPGEHRRHVRPMLPGRAPEDSVAITGIGMSQIGRRLMRAPLSLAVEAVKAAVADAGLELADVDGLSTYPGGDDATAASARAASPRSRTRSASGRPGTTAACETFGPGGSVVAAVLAVAAGLARHVVCFRTVWQATFAAQLRAAVRVGREPVRHGGGRQARRRLRRALRRRLRREPPRDVRVAPLRPLRHDPRDARLDRRSTSAPNAALNPTAIYRDPITMDDYLSARPITTPFGLYDCDVPADAVDRGRGVAPRRRRRTCASRPSSSRRSARRSPSGSPWDQCDADPRAAGAGPGRAPVVAHHAAPRRRRRGAALRRLHVQLPVVARGARLLRRSARPRTSSTAARTSPATACVAVNPHGGQLSAGRTHGMGLFHEAVVQLRGDAGERQVPGAKVAVVTQRRPHARRRRAAAPGLSAVKKVPGTFLTRAARTCSGWSGTPRRARRSPRGRRSACGTVKLLCVYGSAIGLSGVRFFCGPP